VYELFKFVFEYEHFSKYVIRPNANSNQISNTAICFVAYSVCHVARDKSRLWKKADRLAFERRVRKSNCWVSSDDVLNCTGCQSEFTVTNRKVSIGFVYWPASQVTAVTVIIVLMVLILRTSLCSCHDKIVASVHLVHVMNVGRRQMAADLR